MTVAFIVFLFVWVALFAFMLYWQRQVRELDGAVQELQAMVLRAESSLVGEAGDV